MDDEILLEDGEPIINEQETLVGDYGRWYKLELKKEEASDEPAIPKTITDDDELMQILLAA